MLETRHNHGRTGFKARLNSCSIVCVFFFLISPSFFSVDARDFRPTMVSFRPNRAESNTRTCPLIHAISIIVLKHACFTIADVITATPVVTMTAAAAKHACILLTTQHRHIAQKTIYAQTMMSVARELFHFDL